MSESPSSLRKLCLWVGLLLLVPALFLAPSLLGEKVLLPFEAAQFPPTNQQLDATQRAQLEVAETNLLVTEIEVLVVPELKLAHQELEQGRFPGWNPYARFGAPLYANGLAAMAHPKNRALLVDEDPVSKLALNAWITVALASLTSFALLLRLGCSQLAAAFGALCFGLGGTMTANLHFYMRADVLAALPGLALGVIGICSNSAWPRMLRSTLGLALATAWALLSGFPPYAVAGLVFAGLLAAGMLVAGFRNGGAKTMLWRAALLLVGVGLGAALSGVQLLPMFDYFPYSNRQLTITETAYRSQGFAPQGFVTMFLPEALGTPNDVHGSPNLSPLALWLNDRVDENGYLLFPTNNHVEYTLFPSTLGWVAVALALLSARGLKSFVALGLVAVSFVLATARPWLPGLQDIEVLGSVPPVRFLCIGALGLAVLAGLGIQVLIDGDRRRSMRVVGVLALLASVGLLVTAQMKPLEDLEGVVDRLFDRAWPSKELPGDAQLTRDDVKGVLANGQGSGAAFTAVQIYSARLVSALQRSAFLFALGGVLVLACSFADRRRARVALVGLGAALALGELWWLGEQSVAHRPEPIPANETPVHEFLRERNAERAERGGVTIARISPANEPRIPSDLPTGVLFPERLRDLHSYAFTDQRSHKLLEGLLGPQRMLRAFWPTALPDDPAVLGHPAWDLLGIDTIVTRTEAAHAGPLATEVFRMPGGSFYVYDRPTALPRAFVVHARTRVPDEDRALAAMLDPKFEPGRTVVLEPEEDAILADAPLGEAPDAPRAVRVVEDRPDALTLEIEDGPAGLLVLRDTWMPGWTAFVDDEETPIARGDLFFRAIEMRAGAHRVEFRYEPPGLGTGWVVTGVGGLGVLGLLLGWFWTRRRTPEHGTPDGGGVGDFGACEESEEEPDLSLEVESRPASDSGFPAPPQFEDDPTPEDDSTGDPSTRDDPRRDEGPGPDVRRSSGA